MKKQLFAACMALAAFAAFAVMPAMASAAPTLTAPTGTLLATGSAVTGTNVGDTLMTDSSGNVLLRCNKATMTGTVTTNNSTNGFAGDISSAVFTGDASADGECTGTFGNSYVTANIAGGTPYCIKNTKNVDELEVRGGKCSEASRSIKYVLHSTTLGTCTYERTGGIIGKYTTHPTAAEATISKSEFTRTSGFCPSAGFLDMTFALTSGGHTVYVDA
jgi:hypothetical protein